MSITHARPAPERSAPEGSAHDDLQAGITTETLASMVRGLAVADTFWRPLVHHDPNERHSVRLLATPDYDVWLIDWSPGQRVGPHDHGDAIGALTVVEGTLVDATMVSAADGALYVEHRLLRPGSTRRLPADLVHDVQNRGTVPATSIHAYSPPLSSMAFFANDGSVLRREPVDHVPAILTGQVTATVHPSLRA